LAGKKLSKEHVLRLFETRAKPGETDDLSAYECRVMSQRGEDGIVYEILRRAGFPTRRSIELGCGTNGGNSGLLAACFEYRSLMVDGRGRNVAILRERLAGTRAEVIERWISSETVGPLIHETGFSGPVDYLGIDLDGVDYWVWDANRACDPLLVVAEYNSTFGPAEAVTIRDDPEFTRTKAKRAGAPRLYFGASISALSALARRRGYRLVATTSEWTHNAFFLKNGVAPELPTLDPADAWKPRLKDSEFRRWEPALRELKREGVLAYFERRGWPLVVVD
jgi:hypothetical protein